MMESGARRSAHELVVRAGEPFTAITGGACVALRGSVRLSGQDDRRTFPTEGYAPH
jgi:hypothetical protein